MRDKKAAKKAAEAEAAEAAKALRAAKAALDEATTAMARLLTAGRVAQRAVMKVLGAVDTAVLRATRAVENVEAQDE